MNAWRFLLVALGGLSILGCAPRQDPGIPLPDKNHPIHRSDRGT